MADVPDHVEIQKLTIALGKTVKDFLKRREPAPARVLEIYHALAIVTASVVATGNRTTAKERAAFLAYLDDALTELNSSADDAPPRPN